MTPAIITFNDPPIFDNGPFWNPAQPTRLTAPVADVYDVIGKLTITFDAPVANQGIELELVRSDGVVVDSSFVNLPPGSVNASIEVNAQTDLAAGQYVELRATSSIAASVFSGVQFSPIFSIQS